MPEGLEAEIYRRAAERCVGRTITVVEVDERQVAAEVLVGVLPGLAIERAARHGKLVLLDTTDGPTLGLHFGMTGRLIVDDHAAIDRLEYGSGRDDPAWNRLIVHFDDGGAMRVNDPRRWARFDLDPDVGRLGPDFMSIGSTALGDALARRSAALKTVLLNQSVVAGFGNLCVDEVLWHAGIAPTVSARELGADRVDGLWRTMRRRLPQMLRRGGSHRGTIDPVVRSSLPPCPRDGGPLRRDTIGGRTTIWCPAHQLASGSDRPLPPKCGVAD